MGKINSDIEQTLCLNCAKETAHLDKENSTKQRKIYICTNCECHYIYGQNRRIEFIKGTKRDWEDYLRQNLTFPFEAEIIEYQEYGSLQEGDKIKIISIESEDSMYGVVANIRVGRKKYGFPLCDVEVVDKKSSNYEVLDDYSMWFANCRY